MHETAKTGEEVSELELVAQIKGELASSGLEFKEYDDFPINKEDLPKELLRYFAKNDRYDAKFLVAENDEKKIVGFVILQVPEDKKNKKIKLGFRYVSPEHRQKSIGKLLRKYVYSWAIENDITSIRAEIENFITLEESGNPVRTVTKYDGNWRSYASMADVSFAGDLFPSHKIKILSFHMRQHEMKIDITMIVDTLLRDHKSKIITMSAPTLPADEEAFISLIMETCLPEGLTIPELQQIAKKHEVVETNENKRELFSFTGKKIL